MKLYNNPERIYNELKSQGLENKKRLKVNELTSFDQYHYLGTKAVDEAIQLLNINSESRVLDIGSGIGGPARHLAEKTGTHITAIELQPDLNTIARQLTKKCNLSSLIDHVQGDILNFPEKVDDFDFIVSWLSFLHISDRSSLLKKCNIILKPGGKIYIEDFYQRNEMSLEEKKVLSIDICCDYLPTGDQYKKQLMKNDFINIELNDKTKEWTTYVRERYEKFVKDRRRQIEIHNIPIVEDLEDFYKKMAWLFQNGNLGGLRIIADKK